MRSRRPEGAYELHVADARNIARMLPTNSVDLIITSPPYADMKDYGTQGQIGYGQTHEEYLDDMQKVLSACFYVARPTASLWMIVDTLRRKRELVPLPFQLAEVSRNAGWRLVDIIIWDKVKTLPWSRPGQLRNVFEYVLFFSKSERFKYHLDRIREPEGLSPWWVRYPERYSPSGRVPRNIWQFLIPVQGSWGSTRIRHFNPLPTALLERIIELTTDKKDVVMDPFAGSGAVLAQAEVMGRRYVGFEINPVYARMFHEIVRPEILERSRRTEKRLTKMRARQKRLRSVIIKLRVVKYAKELVKAADRRNEGNKRGQILAVFIRPTRPSTIDRCDRYALVGVEMFVIVRSRARRKGLEEELTWLASIPPLSKYGVRPAIRVVTNEEFTRDWKGRSLFKGSLYAYADGVVTEPSKTVDFTWWERDGSRVGKRRANQEGRHPLILSHLYVNARKLLEASGERTDKAREDMEVFSNGTE